MTGQDYIMDGVGYGNVGSMLANGNFETGLFRPYFETNPKSPRYGERCVTINTSQRRWDDQLKREVPIRRQVTLNEAHRIFRKDLPPVVNATSLRKEEWVMLDQVVHKAARFRLRAYGDLANANSFGGFNGMGKMILEHETMSDPGEAIVDMDGLSEGRTDSPQFQLQGLPLPITHSDFWFSSRRLAISRSSGTPLDTTMGESAGRRIAETIEKTTIGTNTGITYGGNSSQVGGYGRNSSVYGYTNFTPRLTYTSVVAPTAVGYNTSKTLANVLAMKDLLTANKFFGPFMLYHSNDWDQYMDNDYILTGGNVATQTLRQRLKAIEDITDVRRLDFLFSKNIAASTGPGGEGFVSTATSAFTLLMVQMTPDVCRAVNGMDLTTLQWEGRGGLRLNFIAMAINVPQLRADFYGNTGVLHATTA